MSRFDEIYHGPDTGEKQLARIFRVLKDEGFKYERVKDSRIVQCNKEATFTKDMDFVRSDGDRSNDGTITINIDYEDAFDYKNMQKADKNTGCVDKYTDKKADSFIRSIYDNLLTTKDEAAVETVAKAKKIPRELIPLIRKYLGRKPTGGKSQKKMKKRKSSNKTTHRNQKKNK